MFGVARTIWRKTVLSYWEQLTNPTLIWHKTSQDRSDDTKSRFTKSWHHTCWHIHLGRLDAFGLNVCWAILSQNIAADRTAVHIILAHGNAFHLGIPLYIQQSAICTKTWMSIPVHDSQQINHHIQPVTVSDTQMPRFGVATFGRRH